VCSADSRLQHSAAPHGHGTLNADIVHLARTRVSPDAAQLDIDNFAGADCDGRIRILAIVNALIQTKRRANLTL
jgi:hypothetical protein